MRMMRRYALAALLVALAAPASMAGTNAGSAVPGRWTVTGTAGAQETTSLSSDDVDKLVGTDFVVTAESMQFAGEKCDKPTFKQSRHNTTNFFWREFKFDPRSMRLPDPVTEIAIDCLPPSSITFVYVRDKRHIVFLWRGFFLDAKRDNGKQDKPRATPSRP
ncbi:hypothetical protein [Massilia genomosp. 1]|uniref:Uncharacterized protein n=1 Tax=Massilia genomosp. 1 TaxID=2609280 RepID=A0ABX0N9U8_9BURK|nr:hypothetical protein [Massilia genomosp. 1]NHZ66939.1 hypothetical protein [Massilia genomosp. 1]